VRPLLLVAALLAGGCATIVHGPNDTLFVDSRPDQATAAVECDGGFRTSGTTPAKLVFPRRLEHCTLTVERDGHRPARLELEQGFSGWFWANFATGPAIAAAVRAAQDGGDLSYGEIAALASTGLFFLLDQLNGAKHDYDPKEIVVELEAVP
jgi:hypothetical protein